MAASTYAPTLLAALCLLARAPTPAAAAGAGGGDGTVDFIGHAPGVSPDSILYYAPQVTGNAIFAILYGCATAGLYWRLLSRRDWWGLCLPIGATFQTIGFVLRIILRNSPGSLGLYICMDFCIVLSPACYFAFAYILFGRFSHNLQHDDSLPKRRPRVTLLRPRLFGRVFIISDVLTFIIQAAGGAMQTNPDLASIGANIFLAGIILQGVSYLIFLACCFYTQFVVTSRASRTHPLSRNIQKLFLVLYFASIWIIVRSVYRTVELAQGFRGYLITNEIFFFTLDSLPLLLCILTWVTIWPTNILPLPLEQTGFPTAHGQTTSSTYLELHQGGAAPHAVTDGSDGAHGKEFASSHNAYSYA